MKQIATILLISLGIFGCKNGTENNMKEQEKTTTPTPTTIKHALKTEKIVLINPNEAQKLMQDENLQVVDVRTVEELKEGMIPGAVNMIYEENFKEKMLTLDKSAPVLIYCRSGHRSGESAKILQEAGFEKIYDLKGGIVQWTAEGKPLMR